MLKDIEGLPKVPSVTELTSQIKLLLESSFLNTDVEGEISRPNQSANGHIYFTLKDSGAQLPCVIWRSVAQRLNMKPEHGQQVIVTGDIQVYPPHGKYQLIVKHVTQAGLGALQQAFEKLREKLKAEGLFDPQLKKKLPYFPEKVGVVTSASGAALQDVISTLKQRYPMLTLQVYHASVQGVGASSEIAAGLKYFSGMPDIDVVIVTRGGGSLEDLWPFNEEVVARAIFACPKPVISAVGHETDFTISDFVADIRAATPTQAVALLTPDINELRYQVEDLSNALSYRIAKRIERYMEKTDALGKTYALHAVKEKISGYRQHVNFATERMVNSLEKRIENGWQQQRKFDEKSASLMKYILIDKQRLLEKLTHRLQVKNPNEPLERGFSRIFQNDTWIKRQKNLQENEPITIQWQDGNREMKV